MRQYARNLLFFSSSFFNQISTDPLPSYEHVSISHTSHQRPADAPLNTKVCWILHWVKTVKTKKIANERILKYSFRLNCPGMWMRNVTSTFFYSEPPVTSLLPCWIPSMGPSQWSISIGSWWAGRHLVSQLLPSVCKWLSANLNSRITRCFLEFSLNTTIYWSLYGSLSSHFHCVNTVNLFFLLSWWKLVCRNWWSSKSASRGGISPGMF